MDDMDVERRCVGGGMEGGSQSSALAILQADLNVSEGSQTEIVATPAAAEVKDESSNNNVSNSCSSTSGEEEGLVRDPKRPRRFIELEPDIDSGGGGSEFELQIVDLCDTSDEEDGAIGAAVSLCGGGGGGGGGGNGNLIGVSGGRNHPDTYTTGNEVAVAKNRARGMGNLTIPAFRPRGRPPDLVVNLAESDTASSSSGSSDSESGFIPFSRTSHPTGKLAGRPTGAGGRSAGRDSGGSESSDSGFIPFLRPSESARAAAARAAAARAAAPKAGKAKVNALPPGQRPVAKFSKFHIPQPSATGALHEKQGLVNWLWPSPSRFYRAALRWVFCPRTSNLLQDAPSAEKLANLTAVPTEFESLLEYQKIMSQLVMKEALAAMQKDVGIRRSKPLVLGEVISACLLDLKEGGAGSSSSDGKLYSLKIRLEPTATPYNGTNNFSGKGKGQELRPPFWGGEMVGLRSARWRWSEEAPLGVVQLWDPVYDTQSKKSFVKDALIIRVLVCASSAGGDGVGGRGGWLPLSNIQECLGKAKPGEGVSVSLVGLGSLTTSSREFQAIMAVSDFPESARRCLLDPAFTKERPLPNTSPWRKLAVGRGVVVERDVSVATDGAGGTDNVVGVFGSEGGPVGAGAGAGAGCGDAAAGKEGGPPPNVSDKLWTTVVSSFNPSQVKAIRKVADGSPSGFTLLQGPPGTGKTRTIMGIVGVLLAGGCPHATGLNTPPVGAAKVTVGASVSVTPGKGRGKAKGKNKNTNKGKGVVVPSPLFNRDVRVLIVAPSNAAVDELVHRLCQEGVPGHDGEVFFPRVVRVGGPREDPEGAGEAGNGAAGGMGGGDGAQRTSAADIVQSVSLDRLVGERKRSLKGSFQAHRTDVLMKAQVVCSTLSGSGSQTLIETMMLSAEQTRKSSKVKVKGKGKGKAKAKAKAKASGDGGGGGGSAMLSFDAVVMDEAAQAVEPSSLIPLKLNPRVVVMVGDPAQLPATIFSREADGANFGQSLFLRLQRGGHSKLMLDTQYRMHPSIASFASSRFYHGLLKTAPTVTEASHAQNFHRFPRFAPYLFHNVSAGRLKRGAAGTASTSLSNPVEVTYIAALLKDLVCSFPGTNFNGRIGVITPYRNQIQALEQGMWATGLRQDGVEISTVDGFQGREKDIMIFSCVRAPEEESSQLADRKAGVGFMDDWRRLNVAITRAKYAMWIVGHSGVLKQSQEWRELINDSRRRDTFVDRSAPLPSAGGCDGGGDGGVGVGVVGGVGGIGGVAGGGATDKKFQTGSGGTSGGARANATGDISCRERHVHGDRSDWERRPKRAAGGGSVSNKPGSSADGRSSDRQAADSSSADTRGYSGFQFLGNGGVPAGQATLRFTHNQQTGTTSVGVAQVGATRAKVGQGDGASAGGNARFPAGFPPPAPPGIRQGDGASAGGNARFPAGFPPPAPPGIRQGDGASAGGNARFPAGFPPPTPPGIRQGDGASAGGNARFPAGFPPRTPPGVRQGDGASAGGNARLPAGFPPPAPPSAAPPVGYASPARPRGHHEPADDNGNTIANAGAKRSRGGGGDYGRRAEEELAGGDYQSRAAGRAGGDYQSRAAGRAGGDYQSRAEGRGGGDYQSRAEGRGGGDYQSRAAGREGGDYRRRAAERTGGDYHRQPEGREDAGVRPSEASDSMTRGGGDYKRRK